MSMTIAGSPTNNGFLDTEEGLYTQNVCFLKTFDTFLTFQWNIILSATRKPR